MAAQTDLWGEILPAVERTPVSILREQAALLGKKTGNLVEASVDTSATMKGSLVHSFMLVVPALGDYRYVLFRISHTLTNFYPITLYEEDGIPLESPRSEQQFIEWLGRKLSSPETKKLIQTLLAQVTT